jgi:hypothetical protein
MKNKIKLVDSTFSHSILGYCSDFQKSKNFVWDRDVSNITDEDLIVYTDSRLYESKNAKNSIAWLIEPIDIYEESYRFIEKNNDKFYKVFTHEKTLLDQKYNYEFLPFGCCWIYEYDHKIYKKNKNISIISSEKTHTKGHQLRHEVITKFNDYIDVYGRKYNPIDYKLDGLKDYRFQIVIENTKRDYWFSEKLIDCLVTGTIPIYWGCPSIGDFFDLNGFIIFDKIEDLNDIIPSLNEINYQSKIESVENNFLLSKKYILPDELLYKKLKKI